MFTHINDTLRNWQESGALKLKPGLYEQIINEQDVQALLEGGSFDTLPEQTQVVLRSYNLDEYWPQLSRNLRALLCS